MIFLLPSLLLSVLYAFLTLSGSSGLPVWWYYLYIFTVDAPTSTVVDFAVRVIATYDAFKVAKRLEVSNA